MLSGGVVEADDGRFDGSLSCDQAPRVLMLPVVDLDRPQGSGPLCC